MSIRDDVTFDAARALRLAANDMPLSRAGQVNEAAADWLRGRADAFEAALETDVARVAARFVEAWRQSPPAVVGATIDSLFAALACAVDATADETCSKCAHAYHPPGYCSVYCFCGAASPGEES